MKAGLAALLLGACSLCAAHEDQRLTLAPDGAVAGLPAEHQPARLTLKFSAVGDGPRLTRLRLQIGPAQVQLPTCLLGLIRSQQASQLALAASWQHDENIIPHYLAAHFKDPQPGAPGFTLLFNLHTARLMEMSVDIARGPDNAQSLPLDLHARCAPDELQGVLAP